VKFGMNLFLWTADPADEQYLSLYERLAAMGFDGIELPVFDAVPEHFAKLGERLDAMGLERTAVSVRGAEDNPVAADPAVRRRALSNSKLVVDCCEAGGMKLLGGPLYAALGEFSGAAPSAEEWARSVETLRDVADYAARVDVELSFEFLNRFEIYLLNCAADTTRFVRDVGRPNVGVHYDTFHAHIEEKSVREALAACAEELTHFHVSENDRGTPGRGQVAWGETFDALHATGYDRWLVIEAFGSALPELAAATKIWRSMFDDEETLAAEGLAFMKREWEKRVGP